MFTDFQNALELIPHSQTLQSISSKEPFHLRYGTSVRSFNQHCRNHPSFLYLFPYGLWPADIVSPSKQLLIDNLSLQCPIHVCLDSKYTR